MEEERKRNGITFNGYFYDGLETGGFSYSFNLIFSDPIHTIRNSMPIRDQDTEVVELCKQVFEERLRAYLNQDGVENYKNLIYRRWAGGIRTGFQLKFKGAENNENDWM